MYMFNAQPLDRAARIAYLLARCVLQLLFGAGFFYVVSNAAILALDLNPAANATYESVITVVTAVWAVRIVFFALLAPDAPSHRCLHISDDEAQGLYRMISITAGFGFTVLGTCLWMRVLGLPQDSHLFVLLAATLFGTLLLSITAYRYRNTVAAMVLGDRAQDRAAWIRFLVRLWHIAAISYFFLAWLVTGIRLLLELPSPVGLVTGPVWVLFASLAAYGVLLLIVDRALPDASGHDAGDPGEPWADTSPFKQLAELVCCIFVWLAGIWAVLRIWGIDVSSEDSFVVQAADIVLVVFLAYVGYQAIKIAIDRKIIEEGGFELGEPGEEGGGSGAARLVTLLPRARNALLITLVVIVGMIVLSRLGVDIAPIFAGAGVVGLAIGFGAQTLVRDVFSGAFFLVDDAFRVGEYVDIDGTRGTVERISVRSMQLRHHLGPLHTMPFGEIKRVTNNSRDWAMMKLELRLTYDTDPEKVRKLVKKLGQELREHPEVGEKFLQPLKSQGVFRMEDSAMISRVMYMTKPGDQFVVRKLVYMRLRELFECEGIKFAHREVTVRVAENTAPAVAGAAAVLAAEQQAANTAPPDPPR